MKKYNCLMLALAVLPICAALADTWTDSDTGIKWTYTVSDGKASLGTGNNSGRAISTSTTGAITIPSSLGGYPVTSIGDCAFYCCSALTSVTIPSSVTNIGNFAFYYCTGLTSVTIPACVTRISDTFPSSYSSINNVVICEGVTSIGYETFYGCSGLTSVTIPSSVTNIGSSAFYWCGGLRAFSVDAANPSYKSLNGLLLSKDGHTLIAGVNGDVTIPSSVTSIGECTFRGFSGLTSVTIPSSVTNISSSAFSGCSGLTSVTIPLSVTSIGDYAFESCSGLTSVTVPASVTKLGWGAFYGCSGLTSVVIENGLTEISGSTFQCCSGLINVTIPSSIAKVYTCAFSGCVGLEKVLITDIAAWCGISFQESFACNPLCYARSLIVNGREKTDLVVPEGVTNINRYAFAHFAGLTSVTIPKSVDNIGMYAFYSCSNLRCVTVADGVSTIGNGAFQNCCGISWMTIPSSVTNIGNAAFSGCSQLVGVTIGSGVTDIRNGTFFSCNALTHVVISSGVTNISSAAFSGCSKITRFNVATNNQFYMSLNNMLMTKDGRAIVRGVNGDVTIPVGVTNVLSGAFDDCPDVKTLIVEAQDVDFGSTFAHCSCLEAVQTKSRMVMPSSVRNAILGAGIEIDRTMFVNCGGLITVSIDEGVTNICDGAFNSCTNLQYAKIPSCVTNLGTTFGGACGSLKSVRVSDLAVEIGDSMFAGCTSLVEVLMPMSIRSIGNHAFADCIAMESFFIPTNTIVIGEGALSNCTSLASVMIPSSVTSIATNAFADANIYEFYVDANDTERVRTLISSSGCDGSAAFIEVEKETVDGVLYVYTPCDDGMKIVKAINTTTNDALTVTLPATLGGATVSEIDGNAFKFCSWMTSLKVSEGVIRIGGSAFAKCVGLDRIELPTTLQQLNYGVFSGDCDTVVAFAGSCPEHYLSSAITEVADVEFPSDGTYPSASDVYQDTYDVYSSCALIIHDVDGETYTQWEVETQSGDNVDFSGANRLSIAFAWQTEKSNLYIQPDEYQTSYHYGWGHTIVRVKGEYPDSFITRKVNPAYEGTGYGTDTWWYQYDTEGTLASRDDCRCGDVIAITPADGDWPWIDYGSSSYSLGEYADFLNGIYYSRIPTVDSTYQRYGDYVGRRFKIGDKSYTAKPEHDPAVITYHLGYPAGGRNFVVRVASSNEALKDPWNENWYDINEFYDDGARYQNPCSSGYCYAEYNAGWDVRTGWTFLGWKDETGSCVHLNECWPCEGETREFYAIYQLTTNTITYCSQFSQPMNNPVSYTAEDEVVLCELEDIPGWTFSGWQYDGKTVESFPQGTLGDIVVSAKWERVYNDVAFLLGSYGERTGGGRLQQSVEWEESVVLPTFNVADGWRFIGWDDDVTVPITNATTFTAQYEPIVYSIDYVDTRAEEHNNPLYYTVTNAWTFTVLDHVPGWNFVGWEPAGVVAGTTGDLVVSAKWERVYHMVDVWSAHGKTTGGGSYEYGTEVTLQAPDTVWDGTLTNYVCLGSSSFLSLTNEVVAVMTNGVSFGWDVWQTNYLFRTVDNPAGTWFVHGAEVEQNAVANDGYRFYKWIGDVDGDEYENPKTFVMTQARYVEPLFVEAKVASPSISIPNGTVLSNVTQTVTMGCMTPGATIYYTLDGSEPSAENGTKYTGGGFILNQTALIRAIAVKDGSDASDVASAAVVHLAAGEALPKITITPGTSVQTKKMIYVTFGSVSIPGLAIERRYTIDGNEPMADSALYNGKFTLAIDGTCFVKAAMFVNGVRIGDVTSVRYAPTIADVIVKQGEGCGLVAIENDVARPWTIDEDTVSPDGNPSMRSGQAPSGDGSKMCAYFNGDGIIEFNWKSSCESGCYPEYDLYVDHLVCRLDGERVAWLDGETDWTNVVISVSTKGEHTMELVYYKDDADDDPYPGEDCGWISDVKFSYAAYIDFDAGAEAKGNPPDPIVSSAGYSVALPGCGDLTFAKHAFVGWQYGDDVYAEGESVIVDAQEMTLTPVWSEKHLLAPVISVAAEYDEESALVTITNAEDVAFYYTTDGTEPTVASKKYAGPFAAVGTTTIKAIAIDDDWFDSPVATATTTRSWTTLEDCLGAKGFTLATGGDRNWIGDADEECVKSVKLNAGETSWLAATFSGAGVIEWWSRSSTSGWVRCTKVFSTVDEHTQRWEGSDLWIKGLKFTSGAVAMFVSNEPITGEMPNEIYSAPGYEITLPSFGGFSREKYTFNGWSDGVNVYHPDTTYTMTGNVMFVVNWSANRIRTPKITVSSWYDTETTTAKIVVTGKHGKIYYTLDGSTPTRESTEYTGEFDVAGTCIIKAFSVCDNYFDSDVAEASTTRAPWTINESLNNTNLVFSMGGNTNWVRCIGASEDGYCMQSGAMENSQETWIDASVVGAGVLSFACKVSSEGYYRGNPLDYIECRIDGESAFKLAGITEWTNVTINVEGNVAHAIRWLYWKDGYQDPVVCDDCAWLDCVRWVSDPIPELGNDATPQEVAVALGGSVDARLAECITNAVNYNAYREWAAKVKTPDGGGKAGSQAVKESSNAWFSYAVGSDKLISEMPTSEDIKVDEFVSSSESGKFDFTVSIDGVTVSEEALKGNLKQVFGLEGSTSLDPNGFSSDNVDIDFDTPENGKVKFTAGPKSGNANTGTFFMKVKVNP